MGMYTEIFVNVDFLEGTPDSVINVVRAICEKDHEAVELKDKPSRWSMLFNSGSYYTARTECGNLTFDSISSQYSLIGRGDIKNYNAEIQAFFEFIDPWCDGELLGYYRYEECREPTLVYKQEPK